MRLSNLFGQTLRESPTGLDSISHQLLVRAGFIRQLSSGIFSYLPLARCTFRKIEAIMRREMSMIGGQEILMPVVHPAELWQETKRWYEIGSEMGRFKDKNGRDMVLAMTHEEVVADLVRSEVHSWRQFPTLIFHIQTKWRDDPRPRAGLIRAREFTMLDSYSLDRDWQGLDKQYQAHYDAYFQIFHQCGVPAITVQSNSGMMGGKQAHEYMYLSDTGEDTLLLCQSCGFAANREVSTFKKNHPVAEVPDSLEKIATPHASTIEALASFLNIPASRTAKAVFLMADLTSLNSTQSWEEKLVFAIIRGDMEVNETKLANILHARSLRPALEAEIRAAGAEPGFASPVGLQGILTVVDDLIPESPNLVAGANAPGFHFRNVNYGRDFTAAYISDIAQAVAGCPCPNCGSVLAENRGIELGHIFKLGTRYSEAMGCTFLDENGENQPVIMGSYGIGLGRLLACIVEEHHDEKGLCLPQAIAPYPIHLVALSGKDPSVLATADKFYQNLCENHMEPLFDDRSESPGVKFSDADLIGLPLRLTISERSLKAGGVELKRRTDGDPWVIPLENCSKSLATILKDIS